ncbi:MAG: chromosome segregation protein SMC [Acidithiobacillales bacterium]
MFRLKKLEIQGFKSFVDRTVLSLPGRITAIVGPNGSGKSNIADAVQWVLGEQSARLLRGTTMEDVIFHGAARRRPIGLAEVSLTLESRGNEHWAETGGEVTIARRVTRDGESDYVLNGRRCRLRDVQDLLLGTGLGVRAYSIIEQQKIELILSTKPQDRRRLIEEAAGVSKYKVRKRQAELKLEETRANLLRLTDIVGEIERTCASLKRQASRAARWKEQAERLSGLKKRLLRLRADRLAAALAEGDAALVAATDAEAAALAESGRLGAALAAARRLADEDEARRRDLAGELARQREALLSAEAAVEAAGREAEEAAARRQLLGSQRDEAQADHLRAVEESGRAEAARTAIDAELTGAEQRAAVAAAALEDVSLREADLARRREEARRDLLAAGARAAEAGNRERDAALLAERLSFARTKLEERIARSKEALAERVAADAEAAAQREAASSALEAARSELEKLGEGRRAAEARLLALKGKRDELLSRQHEIALRIATLEAALAEREAGGEAARRALETARLAPDGVLADHFEAQPGFETALDAAAGAALEAPVLRDREALDRALSAVRTEKLGTARFLLPAGGVLRPPRPDDPRLLGLAHELLMPRPGDERLVPSLPDALVVGTLDDALALAPHHPGRTIVTRDGVVVRGAVVEAAGTEMPGEGLYTVRRDLKALAEEREEAVRRIDSYDLEIDGTSAAASDYATSSDRALAEVRGRERDHSEAEARASAAAEERRRATQELLVVTEEEVAVAADLAAAGRARAEAARLAETRAAELQTVERTIAGLEAGVEVLRAARLAAAEADAAARTARDVFRERRRAADEAAASAGTRAQAAARRVAELSLGIEENERRAVAAEEAGRSARASQAAAAEAVSRAETARAEADRAAEERRLGREELEKGELAAREALDAVRRARFDAEIALERRKADRDHLAESCRSEFSCPLDELPPLEGGEGETSPDEEALANEVVESTLALERLGPVNHAALEEYGTESKRLGELSAQKLDLETSLAQILETIRTINLTSSERFAEAFASINEGFAQVFQRLFRGGTAAMHLLDDEDPLESGLEIMAQPPGKRNQTIGLLSGGEKALTAIALLVAIFHYKPSPFCILDEVDAPLDEANIDRFTSLLVELSEQTQFVLITHNKRTMETAQALYGVTQEEPGVSKLVSVRFD